LRRWIRFASNLNPTNIEVRWLREFVGIDVLWIVVIEESVELLVWRVEEVVVS
jgi:hypothetical protein